MGTENTLVDTAGLITGLWPDPEVAPSARTIARMRDEHVIPYIRLGNLIYYDLEAVRRAISERCTVQPRRFKSRLP